MNTANSEQVFMASMYQSIIDNNKKSTALLLFLGFSQHSLALS